MRFCKTCGHAEEDHVSGFGCNVGNEHVCGCTQFVPSPEKTFSIVRGFPLCATSGPMSDDRNQVGWCFGGSLSIMLRPPVALAVCTAIDRVLSPERETVHEDIGDNYIVLAMKDDEDPMPLIVIGVPSVFTFMLPFEERGQGPCRELWSRLIHATRLTALAEVTHRPIQFPCGCIEGEPVKLFTKGGSS